MTTPVGSVALNPILLRDSFPIVVFSIVNDNVEIAPGAIVEGEKDAVKVGEDGAA